MVCTFFGHRDTPAEIEPILKDKLIYLITDYGADTFYIGNHGEFDRMAYKVLREQKNKYPHITYTIVLAYMPCIADRYDGQDVSVTLYPQGLELVPVKFAVAERNRWLVDHCDTVITYVSRSFDCSARFRTLARSKGKRIIDLA